MTVSAVAPGAGTPKWYNNDWNNFAPRAGFAWDAFGTGKTVFRGGYGMKRIIEILGDRVTLTLSSDRFELAPWGIFGGGSALPGGCIMVRPDGSEEPLGSKVTCPVEKGSRLNIVTPGGGGRDNPYERLPESVRQDVVDGLLSTQSALDGYGVVFNQDLTLNESGTAAQRLKTRS
jgi:N-methylhydantoinase B